jgi:uncharacterized membrane protein YGL010W
MPVTGMSYVFLFGILLVVGYLYLAFYNTELWLRITVGIFTVAWYVLRAAGRLLAALVTGISRLAGRFFRRRG